MDPIPSAADLLSEAQRRTATTALPDPRFSNALDQLVRSINREATLTDDGREATIERYLRVCSNRLRTDEDWRNHPDIAREALLPPLIIQGLPRVGSTKLHQLLAKSGDFQALIFWQGFNPARLHADPERDRRERIEAAVRFLEWRTRRNPLANAAHFMAAMEPEEDTYLLEFTLHTYWPTTYFAVSPFLDWLAQQDRDHAFEYLSRLLRYLQWQFHRGPVKPWVLKSPINLGYEAPMARHLPGARFVLLHRDPVESLPSLVAIMRELRRLYGPGASDLKVAGAWAMEEYPRAMQRCLDWRARQPPGAVLDIAYRDVRDDYRSVIERVYAFCGIELSDSARTAMSAWAGDNEQHKHGLHQYTLDEAGLSERAIRNAFAEYCDLYSAYF